MSDLSKLMENYTAAKDRYETASQEETRAGMKATAALNDLNAAQKALDAALDKVRKEAPRESDWQRAMRPRHVVPS